MYPLPAEAGSDHIPGQLLKEDEGSGAWPRRSMHAALPQTRAFTLPITYTRKGPVTVQQSADGAWESQGGSTHCREGQESSSLEGFLFHRVYRGRLAWVPTTVGHWVRQDSTGSLHCLPGRASSRDTARCTPRPGALAWRTGLRRCPPGVGMLDSDCPSALVPRSQIPGPGRAPWGGCREEALLHTAALAVSLRRPSTQAWAHLLP